ncbi:MAG: anti-sigma factor antagonist [Actinomycetota bacterium]|nr:anti-sigma factor antagonist [Actinomycetota bacterium]
MDLSLATRRSDDVTIVVVGGEIDVYTAPKLRDKITELVGDDRYHLVIDMENVEFLDSTGLGVLVGGLKKVRAHDGSMEIVCSQDRLLKIFRITGLAKVFTIHDSEASALAAR